MDNILLSNKKIALVHYWLTGMRGGEKVVESICDIFPDVDIFTLVYDKNKISPSINNHKIFTSFIQKLPFSRKKYQNYLPLMPVAIEQFDLSGYDIVISNSNNVRKRILKYYRRDSTVIYPPVDVEGMMFETKKQDYYLVVSQLVSYKRIDLAIKAFNELKKELIIIGEGPEYRKLKKIANPNIRFLGWQSGESLKQYYANAKAFIFPGEEDFGITPVEAQASGTPVIGFGRGGLVETVIDGKTGLFFYKQDYKDLIDVIETFESNPGRFDCYKIRENSLKFSRKRFESDLKNFIEEKYGEYC